MFGRPILSFGSRGSRYIFSPLRYEKTLELTHLFLTCIILEFIFNCLKILIDPFVKYIKHSIKLINHYGTTVKHFEIAVNHSEEAIKYNLLLFNTLQTYSIFNLFCFSFINLFSIKKVTLSNDFYNN